MVEPENKSVETPRSDRLQKIPVLNFATFHMGQTSDANSTEFDENDRKNQEDAKTIAAMIAQFKPTIICVEVPWEENEELNQEYQSYLSNPEPTTYYGEVGLVAFEVGRLSELARLYGIDHKMGYNYMIGEQIENAIDSTTYKDYFKDPFKFDTELTINLDSLPLLDKLKMMNHPKFLDFLINVNADILAFAGTENGFEGADEAAKYYQRNLRIYSNLNRIPMTVNDRVFVLSGGSHTAFLNEFLNRSPKYGTVDVFQYLK
ncbi:hypothetical protein FK220_018340 [Flavobacteriaceae bacterium TP-CH-4]|uniref:Uncharacterized protein n=1 Tax=Pelagihabitans pacificus TaxID=2696054 RepID=A0A967AVT0_9FLAO|nr:hypothetical protein [Pelagihabitans pacificus]